MELVNYDKETVTIRMNRKNDFSGLLSVLMTASSDYKQLDREMLMLSEDEVERLASATFSISEKLPPAKDL